MREILFRAKDCYTNKWVYGMLHGVKDYYAMQTSDFKIHDIIPETVGQYTGLTDKNGKKIFEGDILKAITVDTNREQIAVVGFGNFVDENNYDEYLGFYIEFDGAKTTITQLLLEEVKERFEVIGNIHDNPELLEVNNG